MNEKQSYEPGFAPDDLSDGRHYGDWKTRYSDPVAKKQIYVEAIYLGCLLLLSLAGIFFVLFGLTQQWSDSLKGAIYFDRYLAAWIAGTLGGTLYAMKWLYHAVAKNFWNIDRKIWRYFAPHISGAFGLIIILVISSGLFGVFAPSSVENLHFAIALGFLTGYFSDAAAAKLADIATSIFGKTKSHGYETRNKGGNHKPPSK